MEAQLTAGWWGAAALTGSAWVVWVDRGSDGQRGGSRDESVRDFCHTWVYTHLSPPLRENFSISSEGPFPDDYHFLQVRPPS